MILFYQDHFIKSLAIADINHFLTNKINFENGYPLFLTWNRMYEKQNERLAKIDNSWH